MTSAASLVARARSRAGLSLRQLAARAGVPASTVARIERGEMDPTLTMLQRIVGATDRRLRISIASLPLAEPTIADLADAFSEYGADERQLDWRRLRAFVDWCQRHPEKLDEALADPPARTWPLLDAVLAALAETLCEQMGRPPPRWTRDVPPLREPWEPNGTPSTVAAARRAAPKAFRVRKVFMDPRDLWRDAA